MALWGNDDLVSAGAAGASTGATITGTTNLALGASATTPGEIKVGHWIRITTGTDTYQWAQIKTKTDNTTMTLDRPLTNNADKAFQVFSALNIYKEVGQEKVVHLHLQLQLHLVLIMD